MRRYICGLWICLVATTGCSRITTLSTLPTNPQTGRSTVSGFPFPASPYEDIRFLYLYSFQGGADGSYPVANLSHTNGALYGTTQYGGSAHQGTVFTLSLSGAERVLYSFGGGSDGAHPVAGL